MKKKKEKTLNENEIKKILVDAIEQKVKLREEYRATPSKEHLKKVVEELELSGDSAVLLVSYNPTTQQLNMKGVKARTGDLYTMASYALAKITQYDPAGVMACVSTLAQQEELNQCWIEHNETATEVIDDGDK